LGKLKNADTGERQGGNGHGYASQAANKKFVEASRTAEKIIAPLHFASDSVGTRQIHLADGIAHHFLGNLRRHASACLVSDTTLGE
jgi:TolB-like protein